MGCRRTQRVGRFSQPVYACWDVINDIRYDKINKRFYRKGGKKIIYINFLCCKVCLKVFILQCFNMPSSPCLSDIHSFTCSSCFK